MKSTVLLAAVTFGGLLSACQPQGAQAPAAEVRALVATNASSPVEASPAAQPVVVAGHKAEPQPTDVSKGPGATAPKPPPPAPRPTISTSVYSNAAS